MAPTRSSVTKEDPAKEQPRTSLEWAKLPTTSDKEKRMPRADFLPVGKNFYAEDPEVACVTAQEVGEFRPANNDVVSKNPGAQEHPPPSVSSDPLTSFEEAFAKYLAILDDFKKQYRCFSNTWPILHRYHDMISIAQKGTGKTLAFLLPAALVHVDSQALPIEQSKGPTCLTLAPIRELAQQIEREAKNCLGIRSIRIYGGGSRRGLTDGVQQSA
ncbi:probable ATP-dependent RNA helicase DDX53 [Dermacentor andersoni]|uniref:probable ATP-dependent RNA helicase DDX53 n=1 Tax=Dermacentor andersoni TaxID=34620 RepID=UPI003B3A050C